jgi:aspartate/methionine/tyrosine aminotransferase
MNLESFALERFQSVWENAVPWNLSESGVHPLQVSDLLDTADLRQALADLRLSYPQTNGTLELRCRIAEMYPGATPEHVEVTNGGSEANCVLLMRLLQPGDPVVVMTPNYMQVHGLARGLDAEVRSWWLREDSSASETSWRADVDDLRHLVTPQTRAIVICNPNNPTGARFDADVLDAICRIAGSVGAWVISDEIYRGAERDDDETPTVWGRYERVVVTSGLSKAYGLPGLRIGWVVAPSDLVNGLWAIHDYTTIAPGAINDFLARIALTPGRRARILARTRAIIRTNYRLLGEWVSAHEGLTHAPPAAGAIAFVRYQHALASEDLVARLRDERGVLIVPGAHFGLEGYLRVGFGSDTAYLMRGLDIAGEFLDSVLVHAR